MRSYSRSFFLGFFLMSLVLAPLLWCFWMYSAGRQQAALASESQADVAVVAGAQNMTTALAVIAGEEPRFMLVRLDCPQQRICLYAVPENSVLNTPGGQDFLQESYTTAGPARAKALLSETLGQTIDHYLAATEEGWGALLENWTARVNTVNLLTDAQRKSAGLTDPVAQLSAGQTEAFVTGALARLQPQLQLRATVWEAFVRQNLERLPELPQAVREQEESLLTDLSAVDLLQLEDTLQYLAGIHPEVEYGVLAGTLSADGTRYEFDETTLDAAYQLLN